MIVSETIEKSEEEDEKNKSSINQSILYFKNTGPFNTIDN